MVFEQAKANDPSWNTSLEIPDILLIFRLTIRIKRIYGGGNG